jgi:hypothetical protein
MGLFFLLLPLQKTQAASVSEDFVTNLTFKPGLLVSTSKDVSGGLDLATVSNSGYLLGVVTSSANTAISFGKQSANTTVALNGVVAAYVTDANGEIKKGSLIGASWLEGVGMAVQQDQQDRVVGVAQEDLNISTAKDFNDVDTPSGKRTVKVGSIAIRLSDPPSQHVVANQSGVSGFTSKLAGRQVSFARVVSAFLIFTLALLVCAVFIRNSIKYSFVSLGRNPMASRPIYRSLLQVSLVSMGVILIGTAVAYAVIVVQ